MVLFDFQGKSEIAIFSGLLRKEFLSWQRLVFWFRSTLLQCWFCLIGFQSPCKPLLGGQTSDKSVAIRNRMETAQNKAEPDRIPIAVLEGKKMQHAPLNQVLKGNWKYTLISPKPVFSGQLLPLVSWKHLLRRCHLVFLGWFCSAESCVVFLGRGRKKEMDW